MAALNALRLNARFGETMTGHKEAGELRSKLVPCTYGYQYHNMVRYDGGREVNGSRPISSFPVYDQKTVDMLLTEIDRLAATRPQADPVAWRWRVKGKSEWTYDPVCEWVEANKDDPELEFSPLYAAPPSPPADAVREDEEEVLENLRRATIEQCAHIAASYSPSDWSAEGMRSGILAAICAALTPDAGDR